jgi:hypothetical protein
MILYRRIRVYVEGVQMLDVICDLEKPPFIPNNWEIGEHKGQGLFRFDLERVELHIRVGQTWKHGISGKNLRKRLVKQDVLNANVLDDLLLHPHMIPESWKGLFVCFWGTIYRDKNNGKSFVRFLYWNESKWDWGFSGLHRLWNEELPALVRIS